MSAFWRSVLASLVALFALLASGADTFAQTPLPRLDIIVPGSADGGFDQNARSLARVLRSEGLVEDISIRHSPGAGGLIALAHFVGEPAPVVPTIFIGGTTIMGSAAQNRSVVWLDDLEPIAQLNKITLLIVARKDGPVASLADLLHLMHSQSDRIEWVGGSPGSKDEMVLLALARSLGLPRDRFTFVSNPGGGAIVGASLLKGHHVAAATSLEEFDTFADRSKFRILAVTSGARIPGLDVPTLREGGVNLELLDWKGAFASKKSSPQVLAQLRAIVAAALASEAWKKELARHRWSTAPPPQDFPQTIAASKREAQQLIGYSAPNRQQDALLREVLEGPWRYFIYALVGVAVLGVIVVLQRRAARRRNTEIQEKNQELENVRNKAAEQASGEKQEIARQLHEWALSAAEVEIAWMILKGLSFKEIAAARGTSERTVRQQAQTIYAKSEMANRTEFSAHFLETYKF